jgi:hypothetical protein
MALDGFRVLVLGATLLSFPYILFFECFPQHTLKPECCKFVGFTMFFQIRNSLDLCTWLPLHMDRVRICWYHSVWLSLTVSNRQIPMQERTQQELNSLLNGSTRRNLARKFSRCWAGKGNPLSGARSVGFRGPLDRNSSVVHVNVVPFMCLLAQFRHVICACCTWTRLLVHLVPKSISILETRARVGCLLDQGYGTLYLLVSWATCVLRTWSGSTWLYLLVIFILISTQSYKPFHARFAAKRVIHKLSAHCLVLCWYFFICGTYANIILMFCK